MASAPCYAYVMVQASMSNTPYAFMDVFDSYHICNHSDLEGRYAYTGIMNDCTPSPSSNKLGKGRLRQSAKTLLALAFFRPMEMSVNFVIHYVLCISFTSM
ncbi:hypothetical protein L210DRAFT_3539851 [Boletus edulis BED1]|uniref:Selenoprotein O n=1 Tax=Boletus edulis BED1 TaxID=1328754 RepID=A0AAD4BUW4_BOLED|nr:hypothetical protein L210DRAFT_3539851 [Boletus edulis BED1]